MGTIITLIITLFYGCISYYLFLPALTLRSFGFCIWLVSRIYSGKYGDQ